MTDIIDFSATSEYIFINSGFSNKIRIAQILKDYLLKYNSTPLKIQLVLDSWYKSSNQYDPNMIKFIYYYRSRDRVVCVLDNRYNSIPIDNNKQEENYKKEKTGCFSSCCSSP